VAETNVFQLSQPGTSADPLTEIGKAVAGCAAQLRAVLRRSGPLISGGLPHDRRRTPGQLGAYERGPCHPCKKGRGLAPSHRAVSRFLNRCGMPARRILDVFAGPLTPYLSFLLGRPGGFAAVWFRF
jgi:hypothetical protein